MIGSNRTLFVANLQNKTEMLETIPKYLKADSSITIFSLFISIQIYLSLFKCYCIQSGRLIIVFLQFVRQC